MSRPILIILLLIWPLYLNDLYLIPLQDAQETLLWWGIDAMFRLGAPLMTLWCLARANLVTVSDTGLVRPIHLPTIAAGTFLAVFFFITERELLDPWLWDLLPYGELFSGYSLPDHDFYYFPAIFYFAVTAGVFEEIIYRAIVTNQLEKMIESKTVVIIISCSIFAGIHWSEGMAKIIFSFFIALPLTLWYMRTRKIWGMAACHVLYNFLQFTL